MYRPNRIGPWPLVTFDAGPHVQASLGSTAPLSGNPVGEVSKPGGNLATMAEHWRFSASISIPAGNGVSFGVKISGVPLFDEGEYILEYGGSLVGFSSEEGIAVRALVGRFDDGAVEVSTISRYAIAPSSFSHIRASGAETSSLVADCNGEVIMGDWLPIGEEFEGGIYFGWWIMNGSTSPAEIGDLQGSVSIHRYEGDLRPFDPNR